MMDSKALSDQSESARDRELLDRKADFYMPSAEGQPGYPRDLLAMTADELRALLEPAFDEDGRG